MIYYEECLFRMIDGKFMQKSNIIADIGDAVGQQENCSLYTAIRKVSKSTIEGVVMAINSDMGYQHMFLFSFPRELFHQPDEHEIIMKMYAYIPIHNVSSLINAFAFITIDEPSYVIVPSSAVVLSLEPSNTILSAQSSALSVIVPFLL